MFKSRKLYLPRFLFFIEWKKNWLEPPQFFKTTVKKYGVFSHVRPKTINSQTCTSVFERTLLYKRNQDQYLICHMYLPMLSPVLDPLHILQCTLLELFW